MTIREIYENYGEGKIDGEDFLKCLMVFEETTTFDEFTNEMKKEFEFYDDEIDENIEWFKGLYNDLIKWSNER